MNKNKNYYKCGTILDHRDNTKVLHRIDGPAIEWADGDKWWFINDKQHREDGPAVEDANGDKHWLINGKRHREDGPAVEWANGTKLWYLENKLYSEEEHNKLMKEVDNMCTALLLTDPRGWVRKRVK